MSTMLAVGTDGTITAIQIATAGELKRQLGGDFDAVSLTDRLHLYHLDAGLHTARPNPYAHRIVEMYLQTANPIFGPVVFAGGASPNGEDLDLEGIHARRITETIAETKRDGTAGELAQAADEWRRAKFSSEPGEKQ